MILKIANGYNKTPFVRQFFKILRSFLCASAKIFVVESKFHVDTYFFGKKLLFDFKNVHVLYIEGSVSISTAIG
jgi:hypothetical protein